jgi:hypothetical protein
MTEHLPIQRWTKIFTRYPASEVLPNENGEYVTYADHVAAMIAEGGAAKNYGYEQGQRDAFNAAVQRVEALPWTSETWLAHTERAAIIAALREERQ